MNRSLKDISFRESLFFTNIDATTKQQSTREIVRAWKQANRDKVLAQKKRYRERHRAKIHESKKLYAAGHRPQINEYRCRYRQVKKCARELQAQHQRLVPSGSLLVSETAKDLLTEARACLASQPSSSGDDITIHVGESASKFEDGTGRTIANKFVNTANNIAIHVGDVSWVRVCSKAWRPMPVRGMSLIRQVVDGSYVSMGSGLLRLPT